MTIHQITKLQFFNGNVLWESTRGEHISQFFSPTNFRPHINIFQGDYSSTTTTITVLDSLLAAPNTVEENQSILITILYYMTALLLFLQTHIGTL